MKRDASAGLIDLGSLVTVPLEGPAALSGRPRLLRQTWFWLYVLTAVCLVVFCVLGAQMGNAADADEFTGGWVPPLAVTFIVGATSYVVALVLNGRGQR